MNVVVDAHRLQRRGIKLAEQDHHDLFEPRIRSQPLQDLLHVEPWHRDVEQQDIRPLKLDLRERAIRTGQTRHLKPGPRKPVLGFENIHDVAIEDENLSTQHGFAGQEGEQMTDTNRTAHRFAASRNPRSLRDRPTPAAA